MGNIIYWKTIKQIRPVAAPADSQPGICFTQTNNLLINLIISDLLCELASPPRPPGECDVICRSQCACLHSQATSHVPIDLCQHLHCQTSKWYSQYILRLDTINIFWYEPPWKSASNAYLLLSPWGRIRFLSPQSVDDSLGWNWNFYFLIFYSSPKVRLSQDIFFFFQPDRLESASIRAYLSFGRELELLSTIPGIYIVIHSSHSSQQTVISSSPASFTSPATHTAQHRLQPDIHTFISAPLKSI